MSDHPIERTDEGQVRYRAKPPDVPWLPIERRHANQTIPTNADRLKAGGWVKEVNPESPGEWIVVNGEFHFKFDTGEIRHVDDFHKGEG